MSNDNLELEIEVNIRFSDTDAMGVVWHGNYLRLLEDGREAFGKHFGMDYLDVHKNGFFTPIVKSELEHKSPIYYGEKARVITRFIPSKAAKMVFEYEVFNANTGQLSATGKTIQVFLHAESRTLELNTPEFFEIWKKSVLEKVG